MDTEKALKALENDVKALKASYAIAASKIKFYITTSQTFSATGALIVRIKFTPTYSRNKITFVRLRAIVFADNGTEMGYQENINEPQDGSGEVVVQVGIPTRAATYKIKVVATGTSPGTFSML